MGTFVDPAVIDYRLPIVSNKFPIAGLGLPPSSDYHLPIVVNKRKFAFYRYFCYFRKKNTDTEIDRHTERRRDRRTDIQTYRWADGKTDRRMDRRTGSWTPAGTTSEQALQAGRNDRQVIERQAGMTGRQA